jgi:hypothetical protein
MKFSEFVEYLVWSLYVRERTEATNGIQFLDLTEAVAALAEPVPAQWVYDAANVLEAKGYIRAIHAMGGYTAAILTGDGRLYVEAELTRPTGVIGTNFATNRELQARLEQAGVGAEPTSGELVAPILELNRALAQAVEAMSLPELEKQDLMADVRCIEIQLSKYVPNVDVVAGLLESIRRFPSLAVIASQMIQFLYPS